VPGPVKIIPARELTQLRTKQTKLMKINEKIGACRDIGRYRQILRIMKLAILIITVFLMQVSASSNAQITLHAKKESLRKVLKSISKQSGYDLVYTDQDLNKAIPVNLSLDNANIETALSACFEGQPLVYKILDKTVMVKKKETPSFLDNLVARFAAVDVRGVVVDGESGLALAGASVKVKGSGKATTTGSDGAFYLPGVDEKDVIVVSFIGYVAQELKAKKDLGDIRLEMASSDLQEVEINKGYYKTTKELNTGNISELKSEAISRQPITDALAALQGQVPGLFIQQTSGAPGRAFTVRLRGQNSISNGNDPLYILDGVPFNSTPLNRITGAAGSTASPFADINPSDIESIQVLKDADATAIYGSRGANGVILINTKKGAVGKTRVDANVYVGSGTVTRMRELLNTEEYLTMRRSAFKNDNVAIGASDYDLNGTFDVNKYTDWQKILIGGTGRLQDAQLAFSGGNNLTRYRLSGGYHNETTVFPGDNYTRKGYGLASFNHVSENSKLKFDFSGTYTGGQSKLPATDMAQFIFLAPNSPDIYTENGKLNFANNTWANPFIQIAYRNKEITSNLNTNANISYQIITGLEIRSNVGFNSVKLDASNIVPATSFNTEGQTAAQIALSRSHTFSTNNLRTYIIEPQISYSTSIFTGALDILIGSTYQETNQNVLSQTASNFVSDDLIENLTSATSIRTNENPITKYRYNAIYGRVGYTYKNRYVLNLTGRRDGSSRFGPGKQFGNFGAIGAAWLFGNEDFVKTNLDFISFGKLRGSIGSTGNDKLPDYRYLSTYMSYAFTYQGNNSLYPNQLTNPFFGWEKVNKIEAALDLSFFENKLSINATWYRNRTSNQLVGYSLPDITGFRIIQANLPAVVQNTGLEFEVAFKATKASVSWNTSINVSVPRSKLVSYPNLQGSSFASRFVIGMPIDTRQYFRFTGVDPATNLYTFEDKNADGKITNPQDLYPIRVGQDLFGGWSNTVSYKSLSLDVLISFAKQTGQVIPINSIPGMYSEGLGNQPKSILNNGYPQPLTQSFASPATTQLVSYLSSNGMFSDASYIRFRNVSLSYRLIENKRNINLARIFIQCQNLLTITNFKGLDPETARLGLLNTVPPVRMITAGLQFSL
jgi:TonB-linked SusC/RagA family outer membrane protein